MKKAAVQPLPLFSLFQRAPFFRATDLGVL